jgi:hypothetical protein
VLTEKSTFFGQNRNPIANESTSRTSFQLYDLPIWAIRLGQKHNR